MKKRQLDERDSVWLQANNLLRRKRRRRDVFFFQEVVRNSDVVDLADIVRFGLLPRNGWLDPRVRKAKVNVNLRSGFYQKCATSRRVTCALGSTKSEEDWPSDLRSGSIPRVRPFVFGARLRLAFRSCADGQQ
jgi:hypothetical protein